MKAWTYRIAVAAVGCGMLIVPAGAASPEQQQVKASSAAQAQSPAKAGGSWDSMGMRGFSVSLVLGDLAGAATPDNLPAGAKKALSDMRDFLPYKSYRLLDTHWILCCSSTQSASVSGRLRGVEEDEYSFYIDVRPTPDSSELAVRLSMRGPVAGGEHAVTTAASAESSRRVSGLARERQEAEKRAAAGLVSRAELEETRRRVAEAEHSAQARAATRSSVRNVLDSTFTMKVGETVVIGTSRLKGDKALIALLTAASRNSTSSEKR